MEHNVRSGRKWEDFKANISHIAICIGLTLFVWIFYVSTQGMASRDLILDLNVVEEGMMTASSNFTAGKKTVRLTVKANKDMVKGISDQYFRAYVDISDKVDEGTFEFPVQIEFTDRAEGIDALSIEGINPKKVSLAIEKKTSKPVPITVTVLGTQARGYMVADTDAFPSYVMISGPRSIVEATDFIATDTVDIEGASRNLEQDVSLVNENSLLRLETSSVKVKVSFSQVETSRDFKNVPVQLSDLSTRFRVDNAPFSVDVSLSGSQLGLERLLVSQIYVSADCSKISGTGKYDIPVVVSVPSGFKEISKSRSTVPVEVTLLERLEEPELESPEEDEPNSAKNEEKVDDASGENVTPASPGLVPWETVP